MDCHYDDAKIEKHVVMPNHIHLILLLGCGETKETGGHGNPPLQAIVGQIKSYATKKWNEILHLEYEELWQRSYHDHIIRNREDMEEIWRYIDENPQKWAQDRYFLDDQ